MHAAPDPMLRAGAASLARTGIGSGGCFGTNAGGWEGCARATTGGWRDSGTIIKDAARRQVAGRLKRRLARIDPEPTREGLPRSDCVASKALTP